MLRVACCVFGAARAAPAHQRRPSGTHTQHATRNTNHPMESRAKVLRHPAHPILIVYPLGLLSTAAVFDVIHLFNESERLADAAYWMIIAGVLSGLLAAVQGWIDWHAILSATGTRQVG